MLDCTSCQAYYAPHLRQDMGCGYLRPGAEPPSSVPLSGEAGRLQVCPGYSTTLPEVGEVTRLYFPWFEKGQLSQRLGEGPVSPAVATGIEELHAAVENFRRWKMKQPPEKEGL